MSTTTSREATTREATISADPNVPIIRIEREFDAPPEKVFRAHVDAELFLRWIGPRGSNMEMDHFDARTGGSFRYGGSSEGQEYWFRGCFHEVRPNEVIVQTFTWEEMPDSVSLERVELHDLGNGRTRLVATSLVDSFEGRDMWLQSGMETGVNEGYEKLDEILAEAG